MILVSVVDVAVDMVAVVVVVDMVVDVFADDISGLGRLVVLTVGRDSVTIFSAGASWWAGRCWWGCGRTAPSY